MEEIFDAEIASGLGDPNWKNRQVFKIGLYIMQNTMVLGGGRNVQRLQGKNNEKQSCWGKFFKEE